RVALLKLTLLLVLLALASANRYRYAPAMLGAKSADAKWRLRRSIGVETAVGLLVGFAASLLADLRPALHQQPIWPFAWQTNFALSEKDRWAVVDYVRRNAGAAMAPTRSIAKSSTGAKLRETTAIQGCADCMESGKDRDFNAAADL